MTQLQSAFEENFQNQIETGSSDLVRLEALIEVADQLTLLSGRVLDIGSGSGDVVEYLSKPRFDFNAFGVDGSKSAIENAKQRLGYVAGLAQRLKRLESHHLPFEDGFFNLVTCLGILQSLDKQDIELILEEVDRVLCQGGNFFGTVVCDKDNSGRSNRTDLSLDWWVRTIKPSQFSFDPISCRLTFWKHKRLVEKADINRGGISNSVSFDKSATADLTESTGTHTKLPADSAQIYQKIYDQNPWYGNAEEGRCPGMRLMPQYEEWLVSPVLDLGCGRGQAVEYLRSNGFQAEGIDQIKNHPGMRVGDITRPIDDMANFKSVVCVDCIEHLYEDQVLGLFENMKQVQRQAFSIHNGESTGTGQELHVNRKDFFEWTKLIRQHFTIASAIQIHEEQVLYLTCSK
ncbi:MAG: class I SAM-dependent methyltransferase [Planctomycetota bacterium]